MRVNMRPGIRDALAALRLARCHARCHACALATQTERAAPASPPPLAGEGQGGGNHEDCCELQTSMKIGARMPPPQPSPASGGGSAPSSRRVQCKARRMMPRHTALVSRTSAASALARAERDTDLGPARDRQSKARKSGKPDLRGPSARIAKRNIPTNAPRVVWPLDPGSRSHTLASAGTRESHRKLKSSPRHAPPPAANPRRHRTAAATAAPAPRSAPGHRSASTSRRRS
jgi:hypothetical protein